MHLDGWTLAQQALNLLLLMALLRWLFYRPLLRVIDARREAAGTDAPGLQWLAPFAGFTMAEHFRDRGGYALVVVDDLSQHAATHRELALLMRQPPVREAYPGDVFHVHARLLERAARLSAERGGGSLTALPLARTEAGNLAAYIPPT